MFEKKNQQSDDAQAPALPPTRKFAIYEVDAKTEKLVWVEYEAHTCITTEAGGLSLLIYVPFGDGEHNIERAQIGFAPGTWLRFREVYTVPVPTAPRSKLIH